MNSEVVKGVSLIMLVFHGSAPVTFAKISVILAFVKVQP